MLLGLLLLCLGWIVYRRYRRQKANEYRGWALEKLNDINRVIQQNLGLEKPLREIPILVKRTALHAYPRQEVASLSGEAWLRFLDASYNGTGFTDGPGQILMQTTCLPDKELAAFKKEDIQQLLKLVRKWIKKHRSET